MIVYPNAKINIGLWITEKRNDGYHNIESVFCPIPIYDEMEIQEASEFEFINMGFELDCNLEQNLCYKAFRIIQEKYNIPNVQIRLTKQIPFGAGIGGGSSDAASVLKALSDLFHLNISVDRLEELALLLGSDCPFFIRNELALAQGRGEQLQRLNIDLRNYTFVLVKPNIHISTKNAYGKITPKPRAEKLTELIKLPIENWKEKIENDFEKTLIYEYPEIENIKKQFYHSGAMYCSLTGSGSAVYAIYSDEQTLRKEDFLGEIFYWKGKVADHGRQL
jgi:4-diphosphocytidyl-2-C-methyl-D-erythritol kinase